MPNLVASCVAFVPLQGHTNIDTMAIQTKITKATRISDKSSIIRNNFLESNLADSSLFSSIESIHYCAQGEKATLNEDKK